MVKKTYLRNKRFQFRVSDEQFDMFEKYCEENKTYPSILFREFVDECINNNSSPKYILKKEY